MTDAATSTRHGPRVPIGVTTVLELIDRRIADRPDAPAVIDDHRSCSYYELDRLADAAAASLSRDLAVGPGDIVLIAAQAGVEFTAAVLGTLRAGAAYLPIDLGYPPQRLRYIAKASNAKVAVIAGENTQLPVQSATVPLRDLVADPRRSGPSHAIRAVRPSLRPDDLAYAIFTSGSTGRPKGILQTHRCLANFVSWQVSASGLGPGRRILQTAPLTFDVSVQEIFYGLASGGCLYAPGSEIKQDPRDLLEFMITNDIEVVDFPQSLVDALMTLPRTLEHVPSLRHVISAGEAVRIDPALKAMLVRHPEITLHNHYGPAENHMATSHSMSSDLANLEPSPPVGSVVWNVYVRVLDENLGPVADGQPGEVYIGGVGVARGYTDPVLTSQIFIDDPFEPGARLFRAKDRAFWRPDGTLQLLGRLDDLVKIRGYSVEAAEVEAHLVGHHGVTGAIVFAATRTDGSTELQAAVTGDPGSAPRLRAALLEELPDYLVPVRFWLVDRLPLSPNGKLDRRSAPGPSARPLPVADHQSKASR